MEREKEIECERVTEREREATRCLRFRTRQRTFSLVRHEDTVFVCVCARWLTSCWWNEMRGSAAHTRTHRQNDVMRHFFASSIFPVSFRIRRYAKHVSHRMQTGNDIFFSRSGTWRLFRCHRITFVMQNHFDRLSFLWSVVKIRIICAPKILLHPFLCQNGCVCAFFAWAASFPFSLAIHSTLYKVYRLWQIRWMERCLPQSQV